MALTSAEKKEIYNRCLNAMHLTAMILGSSSAKKASGGNIAYLEAWDGTTRKYQNQAYSSSSSMPKAVKASLAPSVSKSELGAVAVAGDSRHANHTEPKLFMAFRKAFESGSIGRFNRVILASERACCPSCIKHTVRAMSGLSALMSLTGGGFDFIVVEMQLNSVREGHELL